MNIDIIINIQYTDSIYHHKLKKQYIYVDRHIDTIQYVYIYTHTILYTTEK